jgi:hypothetical protein
MRRRRLLMSKKTLALGLLSVTGAPLVLQSPAIAAPAGPRASADVPQIQQFCKELAAEGGTPWLSIGECVALNISSDAERHNFWVHRCDNWRDEGLLELVGYSSYSECIHDD